RREMTKQEYAIVRSTIHEAASHFSIPLNPTAAASQP
ncbi:MAG: hypothetical protein ACD_57C00078G0001, partial [uncultured bacterium]